MRAVDNVDEPATGCFFRLRSPPFRYLHVVVVPKSLISSENENSNLLGSNQHNENGEFPVTWSLLVQLKQASSGYLFFWILSFVCQDSPSPRAKQQQDYFWPF